MYVPHPVELTRQAPGCTYQWAAGCAVGSDLVLVQSLPASQRHGPARAACLLLRHRARNLVFNPFDEDERTEDEQMIECSHGQNSGRWLIGELLLGFAVVLMSCSPALRPTGPCSEIEEKTIGITRDDYRACAEEILSVLDSLEAPLSRFVRTGEGEAHERADTYNRRLRNLMRSAGFTTDVVREAREGAGRTVQRWPDVNLRWFNQEVLTASAQYGAALGYPNADNLGQGRKSHDRARQAYARFR